VGARRIEDIMHLFSYSFLGRWKKKELDLACICKGMRSLNLMTPWIFEVLGTSVRFSNRIESLGKGYLWCLDDRKLF